MATNATIPYYRAASSAKNKTADGTETLPKKADRLAVLRMADAVNTALRLNLPGAQVAAQNLLPHILAEGRTDAGTNGRDEDNKTAQAVYSALVRNGSGYSYQVSPYDSTDDPANYVATSAEKEAVAKRTGKSFAEVWNGTGRSAETGRTGAQHADRFAAAQRVADSPKNAQLRELIQRVITQGATPGEQFDMRRPELFHALNAQHPDLSYRLKWASGARDVPEMAKKIINAPNPAVLSSGLVDVLLNNMGAPVDATPKRAQYMSPAAQTDLEVLLSSKTGAKMLQELGVFPQSTK